ncbi:MAG: DUF2254 domain-containing protein [Thermomicrobiales bacterium]|nr:DUF2254 domain-containing protein [Thermomicrobiales bacterium]
MRAGEALRRAFSTFLAVPTIVIVTFVLLAVATYILDTAQIAWLRPIRGFLEVHIFANAESTGNLLATIAGGLIALTSITFSLLLLALQQSAASMTHEVLDQFLRRRLNQFYLGFFVGLVLFALITLATVDPTFNPIFGATLALVLVLAALYVLLLLIYSTIGQMRPTEIIRSIHDLTLAARVRQLSLVRKTRRAPRLPDTEAVPVAATQDGFVVGYDLRAIATAIDSAVAPVEVVLLLPVGSYAAFRDPLAEVRARRREDAAAVAAMVGTAVQIDHQRRLKDDAAFGIVQIETIAWRSISTSQQNPAPGLVAIRNLRDILSRWSAEGGLGSDESQLPIVYPDDVMARLMTAFESLAVVASESMQHQTYSEVLRTISITFERLPAAQQQRAVDLVLRILSALGDFVLTDELDTALLQLAAALEQARQIDAAAAVRTARAELAASIGNLNSRSTRVTRSG